MKPAYLDSSFLVALALGERGWERLRSILRRYDTLLAAELLAAEFLAVARREGLSEEDARAPLYAIRWVIPDRPIRPELEKVLTAGYLRGEDAWHLACACFLAPVPKDLPFLTRDRKQRAVAKKLGFPTP